MISIIVSSYREELFNSFAENVKKTIGISKYELIRIYNPGTMGICQAYNEGANRAIYQYLVFAHEDIVFHTNNWGEVLIDTFTTSPRIGLVGVAGTFYKSWIYSGWNLLDGDLASIYLVQSGGEEPSLYLKVKRGFSDVFRFDAKQRTNLQELHVEKSIYYEQVTAIDGLFMATTRDVYEANKFDEINIRYYHCYDLDFSLQILKTYEVVVSHNILIEHLSSGSFNKNWFESTVAFHKKWGKDFPKSISHYNRNEITKIEKGAYGILLSTMKQNNTGYALIFGQIFSAKFRQLIGLQNWISFQLFILNKFFRVLLKKLRIIKEKNLD